MIHTVSDHDASHTWLPSGFNNTWAPNQSRLIMLTGTVGIDSWKEAFNEKAITLYSGSTNNLNNQIVDETYVNTYSSATELKTVQLELTENGYMYNTILADDQIFVTDSFGIEIFIEQRN